MILTLVREGLRREECVCEVLDGEGHGKESTRRAGEEEEVSLEVELVRVGLKRDLERRRREDESGYVCLDTLASWESDPRRREMDGREMMAVEREEEEDVES